MDFKSLKTPRTLMMMQVCVYVFLFAYQHFSSKRAISIYVKQGCAFTTADDISKFCAVLHTPEYIVGIEAVALPFD